MSSKLRGALAAALLPALGCALNPVTRQPEVMLVSQEQEAQAGDAAAEQVAAEMGIVQSESLTAYVSAVGERVAAQLPEQAPGYRFEIVDLDEPNAFALPGGHVYVSRGVLALANREDELANVIAHEVIHVAGRHHAQRQTRAAGVGLLALPGLLAGALLGPVGQLVSAPFAVAGASAMAGYSRAQELQADELGQQAAARAGYDPHALASFLEALERDTLLRSEEASAPGWFDTHPSTPKRARDAARRAEGIAVTPGAHIADGEAFLGHLDGLLVGENPAEGIFEDRRFLHPDLDFSLEFPEGWELVNTRAAVGALSPGRDAQVALRLEAKGEDAREVASAFLHEASQHARLEVARVDTLELNGRQAVRAQAVADTRSGVASLDLTWIAHGGNVFLLSGVVDGRYSEAHRALFGEVVESFRPLTPEERRGIRETRLRLRAAAAGESLEGFGRRVGNAWSPAQTAVVNGLDPGAPLSDAQLLKVAIRQPYADQ